MFACGGALLIRVFTLKNCTLCEMLKLYLNKHGIAYEELDMASPDAQTELLVNGVFTLSAPVLQVDNLFYRTHDLFDDLGEIRSHIKTMLGGH
jgi:glutaredoxin